MVKITNLNQLTYNMRTPFQPILIVVALLFSLPSAFSQETLQLPTIEKIVRCYTEENEALQRKLNPLKESREQFEAWMQQATAERKKQNAGARVQAQYTIPVIFHIIHNGEAVGTKPNMSAALIQQQLNQLNKDFANASGSTYSVAQNTGIQFVLAQFNPSGGTLAEPGIDRINRNAPPDAGAGWTDYNTANSNAGWLNSYIDSDVKPRTIWNPAHYLNIWVIPKISAVGVSGILLGYATFPGSALPGMPGSESATASGVVIYSPTVGSMITPYGDCASAVSYGRGRTLTHEIGHYLGLRHIWGDANCGTDYCDDTPVHRTDNAGKPTHPKPNSCGTADEMFENYMDYVDDDVMNTFTQNQTDRIQTVMANSTYRNTLSGSPAGGVLPAASNKLYFTNCGKAVSFSELANAGTYPKYRDIPVRIEVENQATGNATVNLAVTGTNLTGYQLPASVNFVAGETHKNINLRVFDNAEVDGNRVWTISYTISGTGVSIGDNAQTLQVTIVDDDNVNVSDNRFNLLSQDFEGSITGWSGLSAQAGSENLWRLGTAGNAGGSGNAMYIANNAATGVNEYVKTNASIAILRAPAIDPSGWKDIRLSFKTRVWGEVIGSTAHDYGRLFYSTAAVPGSFSPIAGTGFYVGTTSVLGGTDNVTLSGTSTVSSPFHVAFVWYNDANGTGNDPGFNIDDVVVSALGSQVEIVVSASESYDVRAGTVNNFVNPANGAMIAKIETASASLAGLKAGITAAGNGTTPITTNAGSYLRSNKVITLVPATANTNASYRATFYFTTAELAAWSNISNLKILKVKDGVSLAGQLNSSNAELFNAIVDDQRTGKGYASFTGDFTGGFSQFMLVSANTVLPVNLLTFTATAQKNIIALKWTTEEEVNNKGFAIERSKDGITYEYIGWVDGNGTNNAKHHYDFTDNYVQPGVLYHYRLRQTDFDNREKLSVVRSAKLESGLVKLLLAPNPVTSGKISLFISGVQNNVTVKMYNTQGQLVKTWNNVNAFDRQATLNLDRVNTGTYLISIQLDDKIWTEKLLVQ